MKESSEKSSSTTSTTAHQSTSQPFFVKAGGGHFFAPTATAAPAVQMKMAVGNPGDKLEQGTDKVMRMPAPAPTAGKEKKLQRQTKPTNPNQAYTDALTKIKGIDATLHQYLSLAALNGGSKTVRVGTLSDNSTNPPKTITFTFNLDLKHDSSMSPDKEALFESGVPSISSTANAATFIASMTMKVNPASTKVSLPTKLYHEGLHMILFMENFLPSSPASPHATTFASYNNLAKAHKDFALVWAETEVFIDLYLANQKISKPPGFANKASSQIATHLVEEKYAFDQEKAKFGTVFTNRQVAASYLMDCFKDISVFASVTDPNVISIISKFTAIFDEIDKQMASATATPSPSGNKPALPNKP